MIAVSVSGSGNNQTLTVCTARGTLVSGVYTGTVTVSGGGAANRVTVFVTFNVGMLIHAPSDLTAAGGSECREGSRLPARLPVRLCIPGIP